MKKEYVEKFKSLYRAEFNQELSDEEALDNLTKVVEMVRAIYKPISKADYEKFINQ